jgi:hypothetical protein
MTVIIIEMLGNGRGLIGSVNASTTNVKAGRYKAPGLGTSPMVKQQLLSMPKGSVNWNIYSEIWKQRIP